MPGPFRFFFYWNIKLKSTHHEDIWVYVWVCMSMVVVPSPQTRDLSCATFSAIGYQIIMDDTILDKGRLGVRMFLLILLFFLKYIYFNVVLFVNVNDVLFWWGGLQTTSLTIPVWMDSCAGHFGQQHLSNTVVCALFHFVDSTHLITSPTLSFAICRNTWIGLVYDCWGYQSYTAEGPQEPGLGPFESLQVQSFAVQHLQN